MKGSEKTKRRNKKSFLRQLFPQEITAGKLLPCREGR